MKNSTATFFSIIFCVSLLQAQTDIFIKTELDTAPINTDVTIDQLAVLRTHVALQVEQINNILITLCETVKASKLSDKEQLCRELGIVCDCMQTIAQALPNMNKQALTNNHHAHAENNPVLMVRQAGRGSHAVLRRYLRFRSGRQPDSVACRQHQALS